MRIYKRTCSPNKDMEPDFHQPRLLNIQRTRSNGVSAQPRGRRKGTIDWENAAREYLFDASDLIMTRLSRVSGAKRTQGLCDLDVRTACPRI